MLFVVELINLSFSQWIPTTVVLMLKTFLQFALYNEFIVFS